MLPLIQTSLQWLAALGVGLSLALPRGALPCCSTAAPCAARSTSACGCCAAAHPSDPAADEHGAAPARPEEPNADPVKCTACAASCCVKTVTSVHPVVSTTAAGALAPLPPADDPPRSATVRGIFHPPRLW